jgi:aminopeptidase N
MPHQYTYGDHVYNKGASVAHNLRWYLGDSLFRSSMSAVLDSFGHRSINSQQMRDFLSQHSGVDLTDFFNDWVFNGGFSHFEVDSFTKVQNGSIWNVNVRVRQRLLGAPNFHNSTPLQFTFMSDAWEKSQQRAMVSGEYSNLSFQLNFEPDIVLLNEEHRLNQARFDGQLQIRNTGVQPIAYVGFANFNVTALSDSAWFHAEQHPLAPDPILNNPNNYRISSSRYWTVNGIWKPDFDAEFRIEADNVLDADLLANGLDSLMLLYRASPQQEWREHPDYTKVSIGSFGFVRVFTVLKGDYALANGQRGLGIIESDKNPIKNITVYPNPTDTQFTVELLLKKETELSVEVFDLNGRLMNSSGYKSYQGKAVETIQASGMSAGIYLLKIRNKKGQVLASRKVQVK